MSDTMWFTLVTYTHFRRTSTMASPISWHARCVLYGLGADPALEQCAALLRGISGLYGEGFDFSIASLDDEDSLQTIAKSVSLLTNGPVKEPFMRLVCTHDEVADEILAIGATQIANVLRAVVERQLQGSDAILGHSIPSASQTANSSGASQQPIKIFVSGDRSQVGKSTCCLGLVGSLLSLGYRPEDVAYIKPATQCEKTQLIAKYCRHRGIECCDIGPIVFYSGFTREFLRGTTETTEELLSKARSKVEEVGRGKKIVVVDGVGYPGVGSICGVSNAAVARTVQAPVVLVGKRGVGDAVDSFNLNACFFESQGVQVLGAIFNRLPTTGFYSLANCRTSVTSYFEQFQPDKRVYGFIPELIEFAPPAEDDEMMVDEGGAGQDASAPSVHITAQELQRANQMVELFSQAVNVSQLIEDVQAFHASPSDLPSLSPLRRGLPDSGEAGSSSPSRKKSRQEIQAAARASGAVGACI